MPPISAVDTIGPAIQRTKAFLFQPFRFSTYLKLCLVAVITEGYGANFSFNAPISGTHSSNHAHFLATPPRLTPQLIAAIVAGALALLVIALVLFYLITRLRFAYFHCLVQNTRQIRPGWRLYREQATRFFWLNLAVGIGFLLLTAIIAAPFVAGFWRIAKLTPPGGQPPAGMILSLLLLLLPVVFLLVLAALATDLVLRDFMLPHFALENTSAGQAWTAAWTRIQSEKLTFFVYALFRVLLPTAAIMGIFLILIIPGLIVIGVFVLIGIGIHAALAGVTGAASILWILLEVLLGIVALILALLVGLSVGGPLSTAIREYALLFYGARYHQLGELLSPPSDPPLPAPENT